MNLLVMGAGYVGICTAINFAQKDGIYVSIYDPDIGRIASFQSGKSPFFEPGLDEELKELNKNKKISFYSSLTDLEKENLYDASFICVGTPSNSDGTANLDYVKSAVQDSVETLKEKSNVFIRSSCPPGSLEEIKSALKPEQLAKIEIYVFPEFLREGSAIDDMKNPDRIVVGGDSELDEIWINTLAPPGTNYIFTNTFEAALIKYANNSLLATLITFANQIASIGESAKARVNMEKILAGITLDRRWSAVKGLPEIVSYLKPGIGYGGSCLPKDVKALANLNPQKNEFNFFAQIDTFNENRIDKVIKYLINEIKDFHNENILVVGAAFKEGTDDVRNSPGINLVKKLEKLCEIRLIDSIVEKRDSNENSPGIIDIDLIKNGTFLPGIVILINNDILFNNEILDLVKSSCKYVVTARNQTVNNSSNFHLIRIGGRTYD